MHELRGGPLLDKHWGELGVNLRAVRCRELPELDGRVGVCGLSCGHLDGRERVEHSLPGLRGREVRCEYGRFRVL